MTSFSIDKQRDKVNVEWMSRPVDARKPLALVLISMEQSLTFADRLKRKLLSGLNFGGAYNRKFRKPSRVIFYFLGMGQKVQSLLNFFN